jgi:hypothetical protein
MARAEPRSADKACRIPINGLEAALPASGEIVLPPRFHIPKAIDRRAWCRMPLAALYDRRLRVSDYRALMSICSALNDDGQTYISHAGMAAMLGVSRELAGRYYRRLMGMGYVERIARRRRGYITSVNFTTAFQKGLTTMAALDEETVQRGRQWLERIRKDLEAKGTRCPTHPKHTREHTEVPQSQSMKRNFLDDV